MNDPAKVRICGDLKPGEAWRGPGGRGQGDWAQKSPGTIRGILASLT